MEEPGVPGEVDPARALNEEADRERVRSERPAQVKSRDGADPDGADLDRTTDGDLLDRPAQPGRRTAEPGRDEERCCPAEAADRVRVEVIGMGVRDEDCVERVQAAKLRCRTVAPERTEAIAEYRIGEEADPVKFDEQRRVAEVRDPEAAGRLLSRCPSSGRRAVRASRRAPGRILSAASASA